MHLRKSIWAIALTAMLLLHCSKESSTPSLFPIKNPNELIPQQLPTSGPYYHTLRTATSDDGITWKEDREEDLVLHASVPSAAQLWDGTIAVYFVDFSSGSPERLGCVTSRDWGKTFTWGDASISGMATEKAVDFAPLRMPTGEVRMYYYASDQQVNSTGPHTIDLALGDKVGMSFARSATVFTYPGLVDPDVFYNGTEWIMHVFSLTDGATIRATSPDGLTSFTYKDILQPTGYGVTQPLYYYDNKYRMFGFPQGPNMQTRFVSFISDDGYTWTLQPGDRLTAPNGYEITDPYVIQLFTGKLFMVYKRSKKP